MRLNSCGPCDSDRIALPQLSRMALNAAVPMATDRYLPQEAKMEANANFL
jgi:hypothetical protein